MAFDGNLGSSAISTSDGGSVIWSLPPGMGFNNGEVVKFVSNTANAEYYIYINGSNVATVITDNSGFVEYDTSNWNSGISSIGFAISPGKGATVLFAVYIDDVIVLDNQDIVLSGATDLVFADGTDMSAVEAGDVVQQTPDQFDEPLESTSSDGFAYEDGFTYSTAGTTPGPDLIETGSPDRMFNGNINSGNSYGYYIIGAGTSVFRVTPPTDADWIEGPCYIGVQVYANSRYAAGNVRPTVTTSLGNATFVNNSTVSNGNLYIQVPEGQKLQWLEVRCNQTTGINSSFSQINGFWKFDSVPVANDFASGTALTNIPVKTELLFADGTDMSALEAGDEVSQGGASGTFTSDMNNGPNGYDGNPDTYSSTIGDATFRVVFEYDDGNNGGFDTGSEGIVIKYRNTNTGNMEDMPDLPMAHLNV